MSVREVPQATSADFDDGPCVSTNTGCPLSDVQADKGVMGLLLSANYHLLTGLYYELDSRNLKDIITFFYR